MEESRTEERGRGKEVGNEGGKREGKEARARRQYR